MKTKEPILLVLAAGMGSRYGGLKQIDPVGPHGEIIIDYALFDAYTAGFRRAVFVIKEENLPDFERILAGAKRYMQIDFAFQDVSDVPEGYVLPEGRVKPWGTGHAVLAAKDKIDAPFAAINADDFYGRESFRKIYNFLSGAEGEISDSRYAMVGFMLKNTITENGYVSRGICNVEGGKLSHVVERTRIECVGDGIAFSEDDGETWENLPENAVVSMNFWGFSESIFAELESEFRKMHEHVVPNNPYKCELFLPFVVDDMIKAQKVEVEVMQSSDKWYGVTYAEDKAIVTEALHKMTEAGTYPERLWA